MEEPSLAQKSHHVRQELCTTRCPYRQGRQLRAVKVYTIAQESRHLLVQGISAVGAHQELVRLMALYGTVEEYRMLDEYPAPEHTEVMWVKFQRTQAARMAKKKLDDYNFFGGTLHICYAPEFETVQDTREKLQERRRAIAFRTRKLKAARGDSSQAPASSAEDTGSSASPAAPSPPAEAVQPFISGSSSTVSPCSRVPMLPCTPHPEGTGSAVQPPDGPHFERPFPSRGPALQDHEGSTWSSHQPPWAAGHQLPPNFPHCPPPLLPPPGGGHHNFPPPGCLHHNFPPRIHGPRHRLPPPPPLQRDRPPAHLVPPGDHLVPPGGPVAHLQHSIQDYYAQQQGTPLPSHSSPTTDDGSSRPSEQRQRLDDAKKKEERTMKVETKKGVETVVVKKFSGSASAVKFVPRQVSRKEPVIKKTGPLSRKPKAKVDVVNKELRSNAQELGEVAGPSLLEGVSGNSISGSQTGDESLDKSAAEIREKVKQFAAIALPPQLKRNRKRKASAMKP